MRLIVILILAISTVQAQQPYQWIVQPTYSRAYNYSDGFAIGIRQSSGSEILNAKGDKVVALKGKRFVGRQVDNGQIFYRNNSFGRGDYYFYNVRTNSLVTNTEYESSTPFSEGLAIVQKGKSIYAINNQGVKIFRVDDELEGAFFQAFSDGMAPFYVGELGKEYWGAIDIKGKIIVQPKYKYISDFKNGRAAFQSGSYWGVLNKNGQVVLAPKYDWIKGFSEGLAVVRQGRYHGYIDVSGNKAIPTMYRQAHGFSEDLAAVQNDAGLWGFIDKDNHYVIRPKFVQAFSFHEGLARVENQAGKIGYINKTGELVIDYQFEDGRDLSEGMIAIKQGGKWGYIKLLHPPKIKKKQDVLVEPQAKDKKLKYGKGLLVTGAEIQLEVFDFEDEDGDSISLFFNDKPILENYLLKNTPVKLKLHLKPNQDNKLVLHAHNLGQKPPNTAAIKITDRQGKVQQVEMISDLANSDVLYFFAKQQEVSGQIDFTVTYSDVDEKLRAIVEQLPKQEVIFFKGSRLRKNIKNSFFIYDNSLKKSYLCKEEQGRKLAYYGPLNKKVAFDLVDEKYDVLGYLCRKAIITKDGKGTEVYYTKELPFAYSPFEGIPGVVLKYTEKTQLGMKTVTVNNVIFSEQSDSLFSIEGYELQSKAEKQKQVH